MAETMETEATAALCVGFIGAGMMATAIMDGLLEKNVCSADSITCSDISDARLDIARSKGINATKSTQDVCRRSKDVVIIAVKPNYVVDVCNDIREVVMEDAGNDGAERVHPLVISVAAGVTLRTLQQNLPGRRVVRVMPNTACLVGQAASGYALGELCNGDDDRRIVESVFASCGLARELDEFLLNAVTGVSGSGPAYVFEFIEALADGGVRVGLPRPQALELAAQTVKGAAEMVLKSKTHPGQLKDQVCSPGGTTIAGVDELERGGMRGTVIQAVKAATRRSMQLGGVSEDDITNKYNL